MALTINHKYLTELTAPQKKKLADAREALAKCEAEKGTTTLLQLATAKADVVKNLPGLTPAGFKVVIEKTAHFLEIPFGRVDKDFKVTDAQRDAIKAERELRIANAKANSPALAKACSSFYSTSGIEMQDLPKVRIEDGGMEVTAKGLLPNFTKNKNRLGVKAMAEIAGG